MSNNNQTNSMIKVAVIVADFVLLNIILLLAFRYYGGFSRWGVGLERLFLVGSNVCFAFSQLFFSTVIHRRMVNAGDVIKRVCMLTLSQVVLSYLFMKSIFFDKLPIGRHLVAIGGVLFVLLLLSRLVERLLVKHYRRLGRNTRAVTFVGNDPELLRIREKFVNDPTYGYNLKGYYGDEGLEGITRIGSVDDLLEGIRRGDDLRLGEEVYVCLSRREKDTIKRISRYCDAHVVRFYFVPVGVESLGISLKSELMDDMEIYTTYENPLQNPVNKFLKRAFDIFFSLIFLIPTALIFPFVWIIIKVQSPGPLFFKQKRTGLDGKDFEMLKFRSMHVNADADRVQATKDDPRKYPFGNFMRKANIDELPQFLNVLRGDMSIVGPRPHMLAHTEQYSKLIDKYMVRHFVKPGLTGWAQVTGFRGETRELWQMEGRVQRDIWYMEHWSIWLDIRIIWLTIKTFFVHDEHAY